MNAKINIDLEWQRCLDGYQWIKGKVVLDTWTLTNGSHSALVPKSARVERYRPLKSETGLFYALAALAKRSTPNAVLDFANKFGVLSSRLIVPEGVTIDVGEPRRLYGLSHLQFPKSSPEYRAVSEHVDHWVSEGAVRGSIHQDWFKDIEYLNQCVVLNEAIRRGSNAALGKLVQSNEIDSEDVELRLAMSGLRPLKFRIKRIALPNTHLGKARLYLARAIDYQLNSGVEIGLRNFDLSGQGRLEIAPRTLRDGIWMQFALAALEDKKYRQCEVCGKPFELSPEIARTSRTLCSGSCKAKAHRKRQAEAIALAAEGLKAKEIAKRVGSKLETVKKWLEEQKEE